MICHICNIYKDLHCRGARHKGGNLQGFRCHLQERGTPKLPHAAYDAHICYSLGQLMQFQEW